MNNHNSAPQDLSKVAVTVTESAEGASTQGSSEAQTVNQNTGVVVAEDKQKNSVVRFLFEEHGVRGEITHMHEPIQRLLLNHAYPACVQQLMMELAVAAVLMSSILKSNSTVTIQMQGGQGPHALRFAFVNIDKNLNFYGSASLIEGVDYQNRSFQELVGDGGILVISVFPQDGHRYQGIVPLDQASLAQALEKYFHDSEQLATTVQMHCDVDSLKAGGMLLQIIPEIENNHESLEHLTTLSATLTNSELFDLSLHECLRRLYWNDKIRVFAPESIDFKCICSQERCINSIRALPLNDIIELAQDVNGSTITCHNCGAIYHLSQAELKALVSALQNESEGHSTDQEQDQLKVYDDDAPTTKP